MDENDFYSISKPFASVIEFTERIMSTRMIYKVDIFAAIHEKRIGFKAKIFSEIYWDGSDKPMDYGELYTYIFVDNLNSLTEEIIDEIQEDLWHWEGKIFAGFPPKFVEESVAEAKEKLEKDLVFFIAGLMSIPYSLTPLNTIGISSENNPLFPPFRRFEVT